MEDKKLLIVGIDPGTTIGYAVLDIDGKLISLGSSKEFDLNSLISETIKFGRVVLVGTDKLKTPSLVHAFAAKLGAEVVNPREDLKVNEKKESISDFEHANEHEGDALASALLAYKSSKPLLDKIDFFVDENKKQNIRNRIKQLVILNKVSIKNAADLIEKGHEEEKIIRKVVFEKKASEKDFLRLYRQLKKYESELRLLKNYNNSLRKRLSALENRQTSARQKTTKHVDYRDNKIRFFSSLVKLKNNEIGDLKFQLHKFTGILMNINEFYILKKFGTLGINEYRFKNKVLNIQKNDVLLVDNPNIASKDAIDLLKNKVFVVIHKNQISEKNEASLPFIFIDAKSLNILEYGHFGIVERKALDAEKSKINWVRKVVEDYRKEKLVLR